jgi:hypothetical protein
MKRPSPHSFLKTYRVLLGRGGRVLRRWRLSGLKPSGQRQALPLSSSRPNPCLSTGTPPSIRPTA